MSTLWTVPRIVRAYRRGSMSVETLERRLGVALRRDEARRGRAER